MYTAVSIRGPVKFEAFDHEYVRRLTDGDPDIERHFTKYFGELIGIKLRSRLRSPQQIEDVRQETFLRVLTTLRKKGGVQYPERLGAFVNSVCNNVLLETYRGGSRTDDSTQVEDLHLADTRIDPESSVVSEERKKQVRTVLSRLPEKHRRLLEMVFLEERDKSEVCEQLNVDADYLRVLLYRAKSCFREGFTKSMTANDY
jgi:RNA polymerase sigma-70 factor, ECF subfamily